MNWKTCIYSILWNWIYFTFEQINILLNETNEYKIETNLIFSKAKMVHFTAHFLSEILFLKTLKRTIEMIN